MKYIKFVAIILITGLLVNCGEDAEDVLSTGLDCVECTLPDGSTDEACDNAGSTTVRDFFVASGYTCN